jgi:hypothetical protein
LQDVSKMTMSPSLLSNLVRFWYYFYAPLSKIGNISTVLMNLT